jgi:hypothetical protein
VGVVVVVSVARVDVVLVVSVAVVGVGSFVVEIMEVVSVVVGAVEVVSVVVVVVVERLGSGVADTVDDSVELSVEVVESAKRGAESVEFLGITSSYFFIEGFTVVN